MAKIKIAKTEEVRKLCLSCCRMSPSTQLNTKGYCALCVKIYANSIPAMPLIEHQGRQQFDSRKVFAGYKLKWAQQGDSRMQRECYVPCRLGTFFAAGENCIGFESRSTRAANLVLEEFKDTRVFTMGDDGCCCVHIPVEIFAKVAERVGARRKRVLNEVQRQAAAERLAKARLLKG